MTKRLMKDMFYLNSVDVMNTNKLVSDLSGPVCARTLEDAQMKAKAFSSRFPENRYEIRQARNAKALGPTLDHVNGPVYAARASMWIDPRSV